MNPERPLFTLLLVDDSEIMRRHIHDLIREQISSDALRIIEACGCDEALALFFKQGLPFPRSGVLTDYFLGSQTGFDLVKTLRQYADAQAPSPHGIWPAAIMTQGGQLPQDAAAQAASESVLVFPKPSPLTKKQFLIAIRDHFGLCF